MSDVDQQSGSELDDGVIDKLLSDPTAKARLLKRLDLDELGQRESEQRGDDQHRVESNQGRQLPYPTPSGMAMGQGYGAGASQGQAWPSVLPFWWSQVPSPVSRHSRSRHVSLRALH